MISVITLTYKRKNILEEAIQSYLSQDFKEESEMIVLNDCPDVEYVFNHPKIKIINCKTRFSSIGKKLEYAFHQASGDYLYRLDDDDLLTPWALSIVNQYIKENPDKDIYRCAHHYLFTNNNFVSISSSINNGNCYSKKFINNIEFPDVSGSEDNIITFWKNANIFTGDLGKYSMIYRWGMGVYHISGMGNYENNQYILSRTDELCENEKGIIELFPHFKNDYYKYL
jgi:glycosyltransferase involved in cell wall biosynthesis